MRRRDLLTATGALVATAVAGCQGGDESRAASSDAQSSDDRRRVVVSNTGEADGEPDLAELTVGVEARGEEALSVRDDLESSSEQLREALLDAGLEEEDVTTSSYHINDRLDRRQMERDGVRPGSDTDLEQYRYYEGTHAFAVEVREIDRVGEVIDAAVDGGADNVGRVTFTLSDERRATLRETALKRALEDARDEAETIASEVGASITEVTVVDASEGRVDTVSREYLTADSAMAETPSPQGATTSVEPGDVTVRADVRVQYTMG